MKKEQCEVKLDSGISDRDPIWTTSTKEGSIIKSTA
jgi:hypothetical protein